MSKENSELVAYCGLCCPKCYKMVVSEAAENLKVALENTHICGSPHEPSAKFKEELNNLIALKCTKFCKAGGGSQNCQIRLCCKERDFEGCWECPDFQECEKLSPQFVDNIKRIRKSGVDGFVLQMNKQKNK